MLYVKPITEATYFRRNVASLMFFFQRIHSILFFFAWFYLVYYQKLFSQASVSTFLQKQFPKFDLIEVKDNTNLAYNKKNQLFDQNKAFVFPNGECKTACIVHATLKSKYFIKIYSVALKIKLHDRYHAKLTECLAM